MVRKTYLVDFDNTISTVDVGNAVQDRFSDPRWQEYREQFYQGLIGSREALYRQHKHMRCTREAFCEYAGSFEIDPSFPRFVEGVRRQGHGLFILSDGVRTYIDILLAKAGIAGIPIFANDLRFDGEEVEYVFPYNPDGCPHDPPCGNCKLLHVERLGAGEKVYIGDGHSDRRAIEGVDRVYAKAKLLEYCIENGIDATPFESFDTISRLEGLEG